MARSLIIEEDSGTCRDLHPHNGYYAGDFSTVAFQLMPALTPLARVSMASPGARHDHSAVALRIVSSGAIEIHEDTRPLTRQAGSSAVPKAA